MSDMKNVKTALVAWVSLFGVPKHFILWIFTDVGEDFSALGEKKNHYEKIYVFSACFRRMVTHQDSWRQFLF